MKIDRSKSKKSTSEVPWDCKQLIEDLKQKSCNEDQLLSALKSVKSWACGKCELYHWIDVLDIFDSILEECCNKQTPNGWTLAVDLPENEKKRELLLAVISFTSLLIEHSFSRHLYNSIEHLITLLSSTDMQIVLSILNLLFVFSKRSNFFSRINPEKRQSLLTRLVYLAENWSNKDHGLSLAQCCQDLEFSTYPSSATTLNFEYYTDGSSKSEKEENSKNPNTAVSIHVPNIHLKEEPISTVMEELVEKYQLPSEHHIKVFTQLRLAKNFATHQTRLQCVQARLNALSIIIYCQTMSIQLQDTYFQLLSNSLIEELVEVLELKQPFLVEIKSACLKALTSIIHLDRNSKLKIIIDSTGANSYHGFLPLLVRNCINSLISGNSKEFPITFATALFSFLYHLASYEAGCDALVQCGIMESLLKVVDWKGPELDHITFVTRAVRVIDLLTNQLVDMNTFQSNNGLDIFIRRLHYEVDLCRKEQPYEIEVAADKLNREKQNSLVEDEDSKKSDGSASPMEVESEPETSQQSQIGSGAVCYPQRAALLKSMLNFLKKAVQCPPLADSIRHLMYGNFPRAIRHIISNAEYYGSSLFLLATDVVSVYVYQEPSLLSTIQDNGLTDVVLHALLDKDVPPTKEVLAALPGIFTSLCLNHRGLEAFVALRPFERLFKIFLSPEYLQAMRRRRSEQAGDTATCLGSAMDELMRHQPSLRSDAIAAIIKLLEEICQLGSDPKNLCNSKSKQNEQPSSSSRVSTSRNVTNAPMVSNDLTSSDDDDDYDDDTTATTTTPPSHPPSSTSTIMKAKSSEPNQPIPLIDYIQNVMKFLDSILSNNSTDDHCREFLRQKGLIPLLKIPILLNLPLEFPVLSACHSISGVVKTLMTLTRDKEIFIQMLENLKEILGRLDKLIDSDNHRGSVLLEDLIEFVTTHRLTTPQNRVTSLLHTMTSVHSYVQMFNHICRTGQGEARTLSIEMWSSNLGVEVENLLNRLYIALVWESTILIGMNDPGAWKHDSIRQQIDKLNEGLEESDSLMEVDADTPTSTMDHTIFITHFYPDSRKNSKGRIEAKLTNSQYKACKPILTVSSRLGRALAELFGLLVKISVGGTSRRRNHHSNLFSTPAINVPSKSAHTVAKNLNNLLSGGFAMHPFFDSNWFSPKFKWTFFICSIGFSSPMLFDDRKYPYYLMLHHFVTTGGQDLFFNGFKLAIQSKSGPGPLEFEDLIIDYFDSWLLFLEKLCNPQTLMDSPYGNSSSNSSNTTDNRSSLILDPIQYLIRTHRKAFPCLIELWNIKIYECKNDRLVENLIAALSHILKGEKLIEKHLNQEKASNSNEDGNSSHPVNQAAAEELDALAPLINLLVEMGFSRQSALNALEQTGHDLGQATELLLANNRANSGEMDMFSDEEYNRALELSLAESGEAATSASTENNSEDKTKESTPEPTPLVNETCLTKAEIGEFTTNILEGILHLIDLMPKPVYKCCDLLLAVSKRNGTEWFEQMLTQLMDDIIVNIKNMLQSTLYLTGNQMSLNDWANQLTTLPEASRLTSRMHLLVLLFNESKNVCAKQISKSDLLNNLVELLERTASLMKLVHEKGTEPTTPSWLATVVLLLDLYEKDALASGRRKELLSTQKRQWKYFDDRVSRWNAYPEPTNKSIDEAFQNGDTFHRFVLARRKYTIYFHNMLQMNDETHNSRAVLLEFVQPKEEDTKEEKPIINLTAVEHLSSKQSKSLIESFVEIIKMPIGPDTLHAVIRFILRLTRNYENSVYFAELGGVNTLLNLPKSSQFTGFATFVTLTIRHLMEDPITLKSTMDKLLRNQSHLPVSLNREMHNMLRYLNPAACREAEVFKNSAKANLRMNTYSRRSTNDDDRTIAYIRSVNNKSDSDNFELNKIGKSIIGDLVNMLLIKQNKEKCDNTSAAKKENEKDNALFPPSSILNLLAELTRSYSPVAKVICEHIYSIGCIDLINEECTALSFILDHMLPPGNVLGDKDCSTYAKALFSAMAASSLCGDVHQTLIVEIKNALNRAILLPESAEKHSKLQAFASLVTIVVESSPPPHTATCHQYLLSRTNLSSNPIVKVIIRKGIVTDLAKVIQSLNLSAPITIPTVNAILKTLEFLSKIVNCPPQTFATRRTRHDTTNPANPTNGQNSEVMEEDSSVNLAASTNQDSSNSLGANLNQALSQETNAINEDINNSTLSNTLDNSNVDDNTENENELYLDTFDFNSHPRSGTFTSDELRTDDDDDDIPANVLGSGDERSEMRENAVNAVNCVESTSSDDSDTDESDGGSEDEEVDEEEDDGAGSTQDEHEEDEEEEEEDEEHIEDEDDEDLDQYPFDFLDDPYRYSDNNMIWSITDMIPQMFSHRIPAMFPIGHSDEAGLAVDPLGTMHYGPTNIQVQHPLLITPVEPTTNGQSSISSGGNSASAATITNPRQARSSRVPRTFRPTAFVNTSNSWMINSRGNASHILQRLLGSGSNHDILSRAQSNGLVRSEIEIQDDLYDGNGPFATVTYQSSSFNAIPSILNRWHEEARVLDGEYMFDAIFLIKSEIIKHLEKLREEEIQERKKKTEEEAAKNEITKAEKNKSGLETNLATNNISSQTTTEAQQNEEINARIEEIANSVVNQVLEPTTVQQSLPTPIVEASENADPNATTNNDTSVEDTNQSNVQQMEVVNEEPVEELTNSANNQTQEENIADESPQNEVEVEVMDDSEQEQQQHEPPPAQEPTSQQPTTRYQLTEEERAILGDQEIPEGVDPSFLAALPENIRQEVIAEQFRLQRLNNPRPTTASTSATAGVTAPAAAPGASSSSASTSFAEVNPEFLAALPPNIQEEVLAQQRAEQQRLAAQNANPDVPVDPGSFFQSLPPSLRRQVLADLDDSQLRLLPNEIATEARTLRQEYEVRHRQFQERLFSNTTLSRLIRTAASRARAYDSLSIPNWTLARLAIPANNRDSLTRYQRHVNTRYFKGKHLLDYDALSSILILIFIIHENNSSFSATRLHRLIKNLCYHVPTRQWVIHSLLEIMEKTKDALEHPMESTEVIEGPSFKALVQNQTSWLSLTLEAAFGSKTNIFCINKSNQPSSSKKTTNQYNISINPQACTFVCQNVLDILIFLSRAFPDQFISYNFSNGLQKNVSSSSLSTSASSVKEVQDNSNQMSFKNAPNFFDVLMRHDFIHYSKKSKTKQAFTLTQYVESETVKSSDYSPLSQLLNLLSHQFIKKSASLTDRLVRLLTHVTTAFVSETGGRNQNLNTLSSEVKEKYAEIEKKIANENLLKLLVDVLVSRSCSEDGLLDATSVLLKLSNIFSDCRQIFYRLLLNGVRELGQIVYDDISNLVVEMGEHLAKFKKEHPNGESLAEVSEKNLSKNQKSIQDRYSNTTIVINASNSSKHLSGKEVQLPSMSKLISKTSCQFLFLRILKIIMHVREINVNKNKTPQANSQEDAQSSNGESKMEVDDKIEDNKLSSELNLEHLWEKLSECLGMLSEAPDDHVVLVLQPAVEAFFLVHAPEKASKTDSRSSEPVTQQLAHIHMSNDTAPAELHNDGDHRQYNNLPVDTQKFLMFAENHKVVLNQILRQSNVHLANGPFAVLVDHTRILDFDVKRRYFRQELERTDHGVRRDDLPVHIRREHVFEDSYRELNRRTVEEWKNRFYIVFEGEEGQDAGGLLREWYTIISREIFNPNYALFCTSPGDRVTYMINSSSHCNSNHLSYFKFVGRVIAKAVYDNKLLECYFTRSFYKHILGKLVKYTDMESEDYAFYSGLVFLLEHNVNELGTELTFSLEIQEFGVTDIRDLVPNGRNIIVTEENKHEYVKLVCQEKMTGSIKKQLNSFLEGFYEIIPKRLISIFNEHELELLISGLPNVDIDDLKQNTEYHKYTLTSLQIQWFWRALRSFDQADRAKFLQFVTGTSKVPLQGFSALEGMNGPQKFQIHLDDRSVDRLPSAHTCFNQLDLPAYETYDKLRLMLLKAIHECSEGFGFA